MRFINNLNIDFIGKRYVYFGITALMMLAAAFVLFVRGPVLSIEFAGGTMMQVGFKTLPPIEEIRTNLSKAKWEGFTLQTQPSNNSIIIQVKKGSQSNEDIAHQLMDSLKQAYPDNVKDKADKVEFIGSVIGKSIILNTFWALLGSLSLMIIYVGFRFRNWIWGFAGVFALAHDVLITYGFLTYLKAETTLVLIAALLTLAGYSINDTIVIFDRVRENARFSKKETLMQLYNRSINETLSRTINTSLTVFMASICLLIFGGQAIRDFSIAFSFGVLIGTYSSVGVALSMVYEMETRRRGKA